LKRREFKTLNAADSLPVRLEDLITDGAEKMPALSPEYVKKLMHEFKLQQNELSIQHEEIHMLQEKLKDSQGKYQELLNRLDNKRGGLGCRATLDQPNLDIVNEKLKDKPLEHWADAGSLSDILDFDRVLLENSPVSILVTRPDSSIIYINPAVEQFTGYSRAELLGEKIPYPFWPPERVREYEENAAVNVGKDVNIIERYHRKKNGEIFWVSATLKTLRQNGEIGLIIVSWIDITERKMVEEALKLSEDKFGKAFNSSPVPMVISTLNEGRFIEVNDAFLDVCGYSLDELINHTSSELDFWTNPGQRERLTILLRKQGKLHNVELAFRSKSGEIHKALYSGEIIRLGNVDCLLSVANDITDLKRTEEELKETEKFNSILLENAFIPIIVINPDNSIKYVNPAFQRLTGFSAEEIVGQKPPFPYWPDDKKEIYSRGYYDHNIRKVEWLFQKKRGEKFWVELNALPIEENGEIRYHICSWIDITERKKYEEELKFSEEKFSKAFNASPIPMSIATFDEGVMVDVNNSFLEVSGYTCDELIGRCISDLQGWKDIEDRERYMKLIKELGRVHNLETEFVSRSGQVRTLLFSGERIKLGDKDYLFSIWNDITDRIQSERSLRESENRFRILSEESPNMIFISKGPQIIYANKKCEELLGYKREELYSPDFNFLVLLAPEFRDAIRSNEQGPMASQKTQSLEYTLVSKDGKRINVLISLKAFKYDDEDAFIGIATDITERKQMENALRESNEFNNALLENAPNAIVVINPDTSIRYVNPEFVRKNGWTQEEVKSIKAPYPWWPEEQKEQLKKGFTASMEKGSGQGEVIAVKKNGERYWLAFTWTSVARDGKHKYTVVNSNDITARKQAEVELKQSFDKVHQALQSSINATAKMVELRDPYTAGHQQKVARLATAIAAEMGLPTEQVGYIGMAATVHDIGKIYVPAEILSRTGKLTELEFQMMKTHVQGSYDILKTIEFPWPIAQVVLQHHERMDGSGYPQALKGEEILLEARILAIADTIEAMSAHRPYRPALGMGEALEEISKNKGKLYDANVAEACINLFLEKGFRLDKD
jgi:PAS domain S-box-containing protein